MHNRMFDFFAPRPSRCWTHPLKAVGRIKTALPLGSFTADSFPVDLHLTGKKTKRARAAFSLVELLVVTAIIAILASLLIPAVVNVKNNAKMARARQEISELGIAIAEYAATYSRYPVSAAAQNFTIGGHPAGIHDFTYGTIAVNGPGYLVGGNGQALPQIRNSRDNPIGGLEYYDYQANNSEVISILMSITNFPTAGSPPTINRGGWLNPRRKAFLNAPRVPGNRSSGVGDDLVYRDPWGNPYIITIDLTGNGKSSDAFYRMAHVTERVGPDQNGPLGQAGLLRMVPDNNQFEYPPDAHYGDRHGFFIPDRVAIWSLGPDGLADYNWRNVLEQKAELGQNKDNILSWWKR